MNFIQRNIKSILFVCHVIVLFTFLHFLGINISNEGEKYSQEAYSLTKGGYAELLKFQLFNLSYILYLVPFILVGINLKLVVIVTHLLTLYSYHLFHKLLVKIFNPIVANLWLLLMLFCPPLLLWNLSLYSESFFIAVSLLTIYFFFNNNNKLSASALLAGLVLLFSRPSGIFILVPALLVKYSLLNQLSFKQGLLYGCILFSLLFVGIFFFMPLHYEGIAKEIMQGSVFFGFPQFPNALQKSSYTLYNCYHYFLINHGYSALFKLFFKKLLSFFYLQRSYYSMAHNVINIIYTLFFIFNSFIVLLSIFPFFRNQFPFRLFIVIQLVLILNSVLVALFYNEWSERYSITVLPFLFLSFALFMNQLWLKKSVAI